MVSATISAAQAAGTVAPELDPVEEAHTLLAFVDGVSAAASFSPRLWSSARQLERLDRYLQRLR